MGPIALLIQPDTTFRLSSTYLRADATSGNQLAGAIVVFGRREWALRSVIFGTAVHNRLP